MMVTSELSTRILLRTDLPIDSLNGSPLCFNGLKILRYAQDQKGIELTKLSYFKRKFVEWAAQDFQWPGYEPSLLYSVNKVLNEPDFPPLCSLHDFLLRARFLRHLKGRAVVTTIGREIMGNPGLFQALLFDFAFLDDGPFGLNPGIMETGLSDLATVVEIVRRRLSGWVRLPDFTAACVSIPDFPSIGPLGHEFEANLYVATSIVRPLNWLGLVQINEDRAGAKMMENRLLRKTPLCDDFVRVVTHEMESAGIH